MYSFHLRISDELAEQLKEVADLERRSMNKEVEFILEQYIKKLKEEKQPA